MTHLPSVSHVAPRALALASLVVLTLHTPELEAAPASAAAPTPLEPLAQKDGKKKAPKGTHRNTRFGFQFKHPKKWNNIAIKTEEEWLAAKYVSDAEYFYTDPNLGYTMSHAPELHVMAFPLDIMKEGGTKVDEDEKDGEKVITITFNNPYKDYDDFLRRTFRGGGYYLDKDEEVEIKGVKVTKLTYKVEKLAQSGPKTISTWIYHTEDVDYAVQVVGLTKHWKTIEKKIKPVRQTFTLIERDGPIRHSGATSGQITISRLSLNEGTPKERRSKAVDSERTIHERAIGKLPDTGWEHRRKKRVLMLTSADKKWSDRVQSHANNLLDWLDKNYGFLGDGAYMRAPIVRVCKDFDETLAYAAGIDSGGNGGYTSIDQELITWWDDGGWSGRAIDRLNSQLYRYWMSENNMSLQTAMPGWIESGLHDLIVGVRMDKRKPTWKIDYWDVDRFRLAVRAGDADQPRELFLMTSKEYLNFDSSGGGVVGGADGYFNRSAQASMLINYLASPKMSRKGNSKKLLDTYLRNMVTVIAQVEEERKSELDRARGKVKDEEDEKDYAKARRRIFTRHEKDLLQRTFDMTFADWSDRDWKNFTKGFYDAYGAK